MGDADKVAILKRSGPGSTPQEPLALVSKMLDSEISALESGEGGDLLVLQSPIQGLDIVRPFNTLLLFS